MINLIILNNNKLLKNYLPKISFVIKFTKCAMHRIFKMCGYFSEICFRALAMTAALSETMAENFFDPIADKT